MSTTERLRKLLDDYGVDWDALPDTQEGEYTITATRWRDSEGRTFSMFIDDTNDVTWDFFWFPTPEQAIEATLGRETCFPVLDSERDDMPYLHPRFVCSECGCDLTENRLQKIWQHFCPNCGRRIEVEGVGQHGQEACEPLLQR